MALATPQVVGAPLAVAVAAAAAVRAVMAEAAAAAAVAVRAVEAVVRLVPGHVGAWNEKMGSEGEGGWQTGAFHGCASLARVLAPDGLARGETAADPARVFKGCPVLATGLTPHSAVPPPRRTFWHPTMHRPWCTPGQHACVLAVLVAELRVDMLPARAEDTTEALEDGLPSLAHELWLLILEFVPRCRLGR